MIKVIIDYFGGDTEEKVFDDVEKASAFNSFLEDSHSGVIVDSQILR